MVAERASQSGLVSRRTAASKPGPRGFPLPAKRIAPQRQFFGDAGLCGDEGCFQFDQCLGQPFDRFRRRLLAGSPQRRRDQLSPARGEVERLAAGYRWD